MPEGDTIARLARTLDCALANEVLVHSDFRVPAHATASLTGWQMCGAVARGKHLLMRVTDPLTQRELSLHSHLRMDGSWRLVPRRAADVSTMQRRRPFQSADVRVVLTFARVYAVARAVTDVRLIPTADESAFLAHLGPDPLGTDWDSTIAAARLRTRDEQLLSGALLDQRAMAGVGNVFRSEILFLQGIHPRRRVSEVADIDAVVACAAELLRANVERRWRVTTGDERRGHELWVYGRARQPCRRCGHGIRSAHVGDGAPDAYDAPRLVFWCPHCQR